MSDYFPPELLIEILLKLPVKSLIRFTTVSKSWRSLISSPAFISAHLSNPRKNPTLLLRRYDKNDRQEHYSLLKLTENGPFSVDSSSELQFPFKSQIGYFRIVGSCDGIICLSDDFFANPSQPIILWNPCVRNHVALPRVIVNPKGPHVFALGFGNCGDGYKVVRLVYRKRPGDFGINVPPQVEIFSLRTGRWRKMRGVNVRLQILEFMWSQVFLNGVVHWLAYEVINLHSSRSSILVFLVGSEVFSEIALPDELAREAVTNLCISVIGESLAVIKYEREAGDGSCDVWLMKKYGVKESWTKLYRIDLVGGLEKVVAFCENGEVLVASQGLELVVYNPEIRQTKVLDIFGTARSFYIDYYVESLVLLRGRNGVVEEEQSGYALEELNLDGCCLV